MRMRKRHIILLIPVLSMGVVGAWLVAPLSRINRENFERIHKGMTIDEVRAVLGEPEPIIAEFMIGDADWLVHPQCWRDGPNIIAASFRDGTVYAKYLQLATPWEMLSWYAKRG